MVDFSPNEDSGRFSIEELLDDPIVRQGYDEQAAVVRAAALARGMREASGLSQTALAARIGTSQAHLSMLERGVGRQGPTFLMLHKIAAACDQELTISWHPAELRATVAPERAVVSTKPAARFMEHELDAATGEFVAVVRTDPRRRRRGGRHRGAEV